MQASRRSHTKLRGHGPLPCTAWILAARVQNRPGLLNRASSSNSSQSNSSSNKGFSRTLGIVAATMTLTFLGTKLWDSRSAETPVQLEAAKSARYADKKTMLIAVDRIRQVLGDDQVSLDEDDIEVHGYSEWSTSNTSERPVAVITPRSTEEVSSIAKICTEYRVPMIPFGAGSSVEGNFSAPFSGICIDLSHMNKIVSFYEEDMNVTVQSGVRWTDLNEEIQSTGLFLPMDPSPTAYVGGMVATNCSGTNAMRYGTMKDWVVNLTVVLPDGQVLKTKRRPRKSSAGYNLNALFTGSEGTLGIITEATLKLAVIPTETSVGTATFPTVKDATAAASKLIRDGVPLAALEFMDEVQMQIINKNGGAGGRLWTELPTLFFKFTGTDVEIEESIQRTQKILPLYKGDKLEFASSKTDRDNLWAARKEAIWAIIATGPEGSQIWSTDVAVPISRLAEIVELSKNESGALGLFSTVLGHVGDGNFHQAVMYDPKDPEQYQAVKSCVSRMMHRALEMEGTVSGEHGIGLGKKGYLKEELGESTLQFMKALKRSVDPYWIMNPGKVFDEI
ncbi:FAD-binding domain-containing protein [Penicillium malachiteum]|nr:FAD-binding domain-containing protein [Penicillium malachiteum]